MAAEAIEVQQLLQLAREKSEQARSHLFEVMGDLFQEQAAVLSAQERALMVDILEKLVREVSHDIRLKLSHRLADLPGTPRELAVLLANDEIDIASPILMRSRALLREGLPCPRSGEAENSFRRAGAFRPTCAKQSMSCCCGCSAIASAASSAGSATTC